MSNKTEQNYVARQNISSNEKKMFYKTETTRQNDSSNEKKISNKTEANCVAIDKTFHPMKRRCLTKLKQTT
jgi:hypothetical protein